MDLNSKRAADVYRNARRNVALRIARLISVGQISVDQTREYCEQVILDCSAARLKALCGTWPPTAQATVHAAMEWLEANPRA